MPENAEKAMMAMRLSALENISLIPYFLYQARSQTAHCL